LEKKKIFKILFEFYIDSFVVKSKITSVTVLKKGLILQEFEKYPEYDKK